MKRVFFLLLVFSLSCQARKAKAPETSDSLFNRAMEYFQRRKYSRSAELFKEFVFKYPLSDSVDAAQYYLAKSYKDAKNYDDAITEYLFLINTFPTSEYVANSYLELAECYMEKSKTISRDTESINEAKRYINEFKNRFPDNPQMEKVRELEKALYRRKGLKYVYIAETYLRIGHPEAADVYINLVFEEFPEDDSLVNAANLLKVRSYLLKKECDSAKVLFAEIKEANDKAFQKRINKTAKEIERKCKK
uniref:Outer membrane protein assembly factor BamD n=1 Tax=candidate division WOR-3 bacterium TaxID=2052148 RepID=A0A7C2P2P9_UNCW3